MKSWEEVRSVFDVRVRRLYEKPTETISEPSTQAETTQPTVSQPAEPAPVQPANVNEQKPAPAQATIEPSKTEQQIEPVKAEEVSTAKQEEKLVLDSLNPTGAVFTEYTPEQRANAVLSDNITTLDKTMNESADKEITIYRGAPKTQKEIVAGDFITTNKQLAKDYAGTGIVLQKKVKLSDILDDKNDPLGEEYIYKPQQPEVKNEQVKATIEPSKTEQQIEPVKAEEVKKETEIKRNKSISEQIKEINEPWAKSDLAVAYNTPESRVIAKKREDGKYQLFYNGTKNEVFKGELFNSVKEARRFFYIQKIKAKEFYDSKKVKYNINKWEVS